MLKLKKITKFNLWLFAFLFTCGIKANALKNVSAEKTEDSVSCSESCDCNRPEDFKTDEEGNLIDYSGNVKNVIIPDTVKKINFGVFLEHHEIESVYMPEGLVCIDEYAFYNCTNLKKVVLPESLTTLNRLAFGDCRNLKIVYIGKNVKEIGEFVFWGCDNLYYIEVNEDNEHYSDCDGIVYSKNKNTLVCCPPGRDGTVLLPEDVLTISAYAFFDCDKIERVETGDNLMYIDEAAFFGCDKLAGVKLGKKIKKIRSAAFEGCKSLIEFVVPESVTEFGSTMFVNCPALTKVTFLNKDIKIADKTFSGTDKVKIFGLEGSTAEKYAEFHKLAFEKI